MGCRTACADAENAETVLSRHQGDRRPIGVRALIERRFRGHLSDFEFLNVFSRAAGSAVQNRLSYHAVSATTGNTLCALPH